ncbi:MAG TPA: hypothetical protein VFU15_01990 [Bacteroidia bacterium]|nr:hypothetical protein [Bacteroidia bacterium]
MKMAIHDALTTGEIRKDFSARFPFLRIEFFRSGTGKKYSPSERISDGETVIGTFRKKHVDGALVIDAGETVSELEKNFREQFGLNVQVMRRAGNTWLMTTSTDTMPLENLDELGAELAGPPETGEPVDIHEQS